MENDRSLTFVVAIVALVAIVTVGILGFRATSVAPASTSVPYSPGVPMMSSPEASSGPAENFGGLATEIPDIEALARDSTEIVVSRNDLPRQQISFSTGDLYMFVDGKGYVHSGYYPIQGSITVEQGLGTWDGGPRVFGGKRDGYFYSVSLRPISSLTTLAGPKINLNAFAEPNGFGTVSIYKYSWGSSTAHYKAPQGALSIRTDEVVADTHLLPGTYNKGQYYFESGSGVRYMSVITEATVVNG